MIEVLKRSEQESAVSTTGDSSPSILMCLLKHGCGPGYPSKKMKRDHHSENKPTSNSDQHFADFHQKIQTYIKSNERRCKTSRKSEKRQSPYPHKLEYLLKSDNRKLEQLLSEPAWQTDNPYQQTDNYRQESCSPVSQPPTYDSPILRTILKHFPDRTSSDNENRFYNNNCINFSERSVRFGRVPKNEKDRITHAMKVALNQKQMYLGDSEFTAQTYNDHILVHFKEYSGHIEHLVRSVIDQAADYHHKNIDDNWEKNLCKFSYISNIHKEPLERVVSQIVLFAKNLPGFHSIEQSDKIILLRGCIVEIFLITIAHLINTLCYKTIATSGYIIFSCVFDGHFPWTSAISTSLTTFVEKFKSVHFKECDLALLSAAIVVNPNRANLKEPSKLSVLNKNIVQFLSSTSSVPSSAISSILYDVSNVYTNSNESRVSEFEDCNYYSMDDRKVEISSPTSTIDEEMSPPGSAESGFSTDSGGSTDSGIGMESNIFSDSNIYSSSNHISGSGRMGGDAMEISEDLDNHHQRAWHRPQPTSGMREKQSVLMKALKEPSKLTLPAFNQYVRESEFHQHKKFRRSNKSHSYSSSPSPSSSLSSSPSRISSSPYSSPNPSSPAVSTSILAQRLSCPPKHIPKTTLMQSLSQEPRSLSRMKLSETLHSSIMNGDTRVTVPHHVLSAPSPSRYDSVSSRTSSPAQQMSSLCNSLTASPASHMSSPPHSYSSPIMTSPHLYSPDSAGVTGMGPNGCSNSFDDTQPLNLSTKTPPPAAEIC